MPKFQVVSGQQFQDLLTPKLKGEPEPKCQAVHGPKFPRRSQLTFHIVAGPQVFFS